MNHPYTIFFFLLIIVFISILYRGKITKLFKIFFCTKDLPYNLAICRIIVFFVLLISIIGNEQDSMWYSTIPPELQIDLPVFSTLINYFPLNKSFIWVCNKLFIISSVFSMAGLFFKVSSILTVLLGTYCLGLTNLYGKIIHIHHHLLWFAAILSFSKCTDVLSIDSILRNKKNKTQINKSNDYVLPIRYMWLLIGIIYFFPGFWKIKSDGIGWATGDTLKYLFYDMWLTFDFIPSFRIDLYPVLYKSLGLFAVIFELSFIFLAFSPKLRVIAIITGLIFHTSNYYLMRTPFWTLPLCYLLFVNWNKFLKIKKTTNENTVGLKSVLFSPVSFIAIPIIIISSICGIKKIDSWPFGIYPCFDNLSYYPRYVDTISHKKKMLLIEAFDSNSEKIPIDLSLVIKKLHISRWDNLLRRIANCKNTNKQKMLCLSLFNLLQQNDPTLNKARYIKVFVVTQSTVPEMKKQNPINKKLVFELKINRIDQT